MKALYALIFMLCMSSVALNAMQKSSLINSEPTRFAKRINGALFRFYSTHNIDKKNDKIERLLIVIQGNGRDAASRMRMAHELSIDMNREHETLIIAPCFKTSEDKLLKQEPYWKNAGWKQGDRSLDQTRLSSFAVIDELIKEITISGNFPLLAGIIVSGHSAGAQFTQRYALTSTIADTFPHIQFKFVIMNPSSYTYLNAERPYKPFHSVPHFNDYKYGLTKRNAYSSSRPKKQLRKTYLARQVYYVMGQDDCDPVAEELDTHAPAMLQGPNRLARGQNYFRHIQNFVNHHKFIEIPNVGHDAEAMYGSKEVREILFY